MAVVVMEGRPVARHFEISGVLRCYGERKDTSLTYNATCLAGASICDWIKV